MATYNFQKFTINGVDYPGTLVGTTQQIGVTVTMDVSVTAVYTVAAPLQSTLLITQSGLGSITPAAGSYPYNTDQSAILTAAAASGWRFNYWLIDGSQVTTNPLTLSMAANHTAQAIFTQIPQWTIVVQNPIGQGSTNPAPGVYTNIDGDVVQFTATPASGWLFSNWVRNGANVSSNPLTVTVTANQNIQAVFTQIPIPKFTLTITVAGQATSPVAGSYEYTQGETAHLTATPATGWSFTKWNLDGYDLLPNAGLDLIMNSNHTLAATFTQNVPEDELMLTKGQYTIWRSATLGDYYVKLNGVLQQRYPTYEEALAFVNSKSTNFTIPAILAGLGVGSYLILTRL
jgi:hypothetical protein